MITRAVHAPVVEMGRPGVKQIDPDPRHEAKIVVLMRTVFPHLIPIRRSTRVASA
jgi:hypothetical protein